MVQVILYEHVIEGQGQQGQLILVIHMASSLNVEELPLFFRHANIQLEIYEIVCWLATILVTLSALIVVWIHYIVFIDFLKNFFKWFGHACDVDHVNQTLLVKLTRPTIVAWAIRSICFGTALYNLEL